MARVLYVHSRRNTFIRIDREALAERHEVVDHLQPGFRPRPLRMWRQMRSCDVVFGWFASWHTFFALAMARMLGKPSVLVIGGFDTAAMPEIGYGSQRGGLRRWIVRRTVAGATRLITNSRYSLGEIERNLGLGPDRVSVVLHGIPDRFDRSGGPSGTTGSAPPRRLALTVGAVYSVNLRRKGHLPFLRAAELLPDVEFVLAGAWWDSTGPELSLAAPGNVRLTGHLPDEKLDELFREAAVYVQASLHEGFGLSLAEAMLARAVPVVTPAGALPEVVGDVGVVIDDAGPEAVASGVRAALELGPAEGERARERVRECFTYEMRRDGICREVDLALSKMKTS